MKYLKFTYVDAVTGISIASEPAENGPVFPPVAGLQFSWARESQYPTDAPEFFGTCPDSSDTQIDGVLGVFSESDWENMRADEMLARRPIVPASCTRRQGLLALLSYGIKRSEIETQIETIEDEMEREAAWIEYLADTWDLGNPRLQAMWAALGGTPEQLPELFRLAVTL